VAASSRRSCAICLSFSIRSSSLRSDAIASSCGATAPLGASNVIRLRGGETQVVEQVLHIDLKSLIVGVENCGVLQLGSPFARAATGQQRLENLVSEHYEGGHGADPVGVRPRWARRSDATGSQKTSREFDINATVHASQELRLANQALMTDLMRNTAVLKAGAPDFWQQPGRSGIARFRSARHGRRSARRVYEGIQAPSSDHHCLWHRSTGAVSRHREQPCSKRGGS
jgi:hypothetical protein